MPELVLWLRRRRRRLTFLAVRTLIRAVGFDGARRLGEWLGELQFRVAWLQRRRYTRDLAQLLGRPADDPAVREMMRTAYRVNNAAVLEVMAMFDRRQDPERLAAHCEISGLEHLQSALDAGRGAILLGAHTGNGLLVPVQLASMGWSVSVVYRHARMMSAGLFEQGLALYGIEGILANEGIKAYGRMLGALRKGRIVFLMMDQGVKKAEDGIAMRFLGKVMPMTAGPAQLARHSRAPVLPVAATAAEPKWCFSIEPPVPRTAGATLEADLESLVRLTERQVLRHPELWSWHHRRWRKFPLAATPQGGGVGS